MNLDALAEKLWRTLELKQSQKDRETIRAALAQARNEALEEAARECRASVKRGDGVGARHFFEIEEAILRLKNHPRFANVSCSQCGRDFGPGDSGFSHCSDHAAIRSLEVKP